jgi:hypothetical protein
MAIPRACVGPAGTAGTQCAKPTLIPSDASDAVMSVRVTIATAIPAAYLRYTLESRCRDSRLRCGRRRDRDALGSSQTRLRRLLFAVVKNQLPRVPPPVGSGPLQRGYARQRWIVDAHKSDGRRYLVEPDELLTASLELEATLLLCVRGARARDC